MTYIDHETKNISFLNVWKQFRNDGLLRPPLFIFTLYDKDLIDIDPYDPNLTTIQKSKIILECTRNPWYYFREVARIYDMGVCNPDGSPPAMFELNKGNLAIIHTALLGMDHIVRLPRQHYREITYKQLLTYHFLFGANGNKTALFGPSADDNTDVIDYIRNTIFYLPNYFHPNTKFADNIKYFKNMNINSGVYKVQIPKSNDRADKIARALDANIQYYHLADNNKYLEILLHSSLPNFRRNQTRNGEHGPSKPYGIMVSSFINDDNSSFFVDHLISGALKWDDKFYDMSDEELREVMDKNSPNNFVHIQYDYKELGKDDEWFREQSKMLNNDEVRINRELLLKR